MSRPEPMVRSTGLNGFAGLLGQLRGDLRLETLLDEVGIDPADASDEDGSVPLAAYSQLFEIASQRTGTECFGLAFAKVYPRKASGVLGFLIAHAPDLRTTVQCMSRYLRLQTDALTLDLEEEGGLARITWRYDFTFDTPRRQVTEFVMAVFVIRGRQLFGDDWRPLSTEFEYRQPRDLEDYHAVFGRSLRFDAGLNRMTIRADLLSRRSQEDNPDLFKMLSRLAERDLSERAQASDILARVSELIAERLPLEGIDLEGAAAALDISARQLQARLKRRDTSFEAEVANTRERLARRYLRDTDMSMTDIALLLGFSELSSFTRAARTWFEMPPSAYRQQLRQSAPSP